jgi:hypothetical protein
MNFVIGGARFLARHCYFALAFSLSLYPVTEWTIAYIDGPDALYYGVAAPIAAESIVFSMTYNFYLGPFLPQFALLCLIAFALTRAPGWAGLRLSGPVAWTTVGIVTAAVWAWAALQLFMIVVLTSGASRILLWYDDDWHQRVEHVAVLGQRVF